MKYLLKKSNLRLNGTISLESSKSESNRALIINALAEGHHSNIQNLSNARDTQTMLRLLSHYQDIYDVKDAGTTMRFLTAYLALKGGDVIITGTDRMKQRPIGPLVNALRELGASIDYVEEDGYPPLRINRLTNQVVSEISLPGNISSQYISALLMIAPYLPSGLTINLTTEIFSRPYIQMTLDLMKSFGVSHTWEDHSIHIPAQTYQPTSYSIESDWSGASYWYGFAALADEVGSLYLSGLKKQSTQGDQAIASIMENMGVKTTFKTEAIEIQKAPLKQEKLKLDFRTCPDLAQTVMVAAAASGIELEMTGLESLKIKETDRVKAMQNELHKIGSELVEKSYVWTLKPSGSLPSSVEIETYEDHRMAMAFAPLCSLMDVTIDDPSVVNKSYPSFWEHVSSIGVEIEEN